MRWPELAALAIISVGLRVAFRTWNMAEYTDGILQLTLLDGIERSDPIARILAHFASLFFSDRIGLVPWMFPPQGNPYWPPFYTVLAKGMQFLVADPTMAGRLVSCVAGGLGVVPIAILGSRLGGRTAGIFAGMLFLVLPESLRWGVRVMTDATFVTLFAWAIVILFPRSGRPRSGWRIAAGTVVAVAAAMTRYQGLLLGPLLVWELGHLLLDRRRYDRGDFGERGVDFESTQRVAAVGRPLSARDFRGLHPSAIFVSLAAQALWIVMPLWMLFAGFAHGQQVANRTGGEQGLSLGQTLAAYWNLMESYLWLFPYSLTPPVALAFACGLFSTRAAQLGPPRWLLWLFTYSSLAILTTQGAFGIFDFRYMMPLLAFVAPYAGLGVARLNQSLTRWRNLALAGIVIIFVWPFLFGLCSLAFQHESFGDLFVVSQSTKKYMQEQEANPEWAGKPPIRVFTNEFYNANYPVVKVSFWVGRPAQPDPEFQRYMLSLRRPVDLTPLLHEGDIVIVSTSYASGGLEGIYAYLSFLEKRYLLDMVDQDAMAPMPLLSDIMEVPGTHGSPLAWNFRYTRQSFSSAAVRIVGIRK